MYIIIWFTIYLIGFNIIYGIRKKKFMEKAAESYPLEDIEKRVKMLNGKYNLIRRSDIIASIFLIVSSFTWIYGNYVNDLPSEHWSIIFTGLAFIIGSLIMSNVFRSVSQIPVMLYITKSITKRRYNQYIISNILVSITHTVGVMTGFFTLLYI